MFEILIGRWIEITVNGDVNVTNKVGTPQGVPTRF